MFVTTSEASSILGISLQGVHYRIKKGLIKSKKENNKNFVFIDKNLYNKKNQNNSNEDILKIKDDQIKLLQSHINDIKAQYEKEIKRLDKSNEKMIEVFKSEINLLKQAYYEMSEVYKLEHKQTNNETKYITIKDFFTFMKNHNKSTLEIKTILLDKIKQNDKRFLYNKTNKKILILNSDFLDLI